MARASGARADLAGSATSPGWSSADAAWESGTGWPGSRSRCCWRSGSCRLGPQSSLAPLALLVAAGAQAPERHFGFVENEAVGLRRIEAWSCADGAVHVGGRPAHAANDVVVVVADPCLIERWAAGWLDAA